MGVFMSDSQLKHVKTILVFRHGARAPSKPALDTFSTNAAVKKSWTLPNGELFVDSLTEDGKKQCVTLGKWSRKHLQEKNSSFDTVDPSKIWWRSSRIGRVKNSGKMFWEGFCSDENVEISDVPFEGEEEHVADTYFRTWVSNVEYKKWADSLVKSKEFVVKGTEKKQELDDIVEVLSLTPFKSYPKSVVLYGMTFAREMVDCERYYSEMKEKPLQNILSPEQFKTIDELSLWCWDFRFFNHADFKQTLGAKLLKEIMEDMQNLHNSSLFSLYSGHDYTILILLASMGISNYPTLLSFGAYLLFEVYDRVNEDGTTQRVFTVALNPEPFEISQKPTEELQENNAHLIPQPGGDNYWPLLSI